MFETGYLTIGRVRGAPIRVHWTAPIGAVAFTGFSFSPPLWAGFVGLVILHELGHAALVRRYGHRVVAVHVHGFGGDCQWEGDPTAAESAAIAWGGVLAEGILWIAATIALMLLGWPKSPALAALAFTCTVTNGHMILFNLLPIPPLDGYRAWPLLPMLWRAFKEKRAYQRDRVARRRAKDREIAAANQRAAVKKELSALDAADQAPAPIPPEIKAMLDRITSQVGREERDKRKP